jgi:hypothetical protein
MGDWTLVIHGTGPHHDNHPHDADAIGGEAVEALRRAGHTIHHAAIMHGGRHSLLSSEHGGPIPGLGEFLPNSELHK